MLADTEQLGKLVDDDKPLPLKTVDQTKQVSHATEGWSKLEDRLECFGELPDLGALTAAVADKNDRVLSIRKPTEKPTLSRTAPAVDNHNRVIVTMRPPVLNRRELRVSVAELASMGKRVH
jgi:hypothetical protein